MTASSITQIRPVIARNPRRTLRLFARGGFQVLGNLLSMVRNPSLAPLYLRKALPWRALLDDKECNQVISAWATGRLDRKMLTDVFPGVSDQEIALDGFFHRVVGWSMDFKEICALLALMRAQGAKRVLEVGTFDGLVAKNIARNLPEGGRVVTLDLPPEKDDSPEVRQRIGNVTDHDQVGFRYRGCSVEGKIEQRFGNSMTIDWKSLGGPFDLIFIDACHKYDFVLNDTEKALSVLAPGGIIVWHDYGMFPGVSKAVDEFAGCGNLFALKGTRLAIGVFPDHR